MANIIGRILGWLLACIAIMAVIAIVLGIACGAMWFWLKMFGLLMKLFGW